MNIIEEILLRDEFRDNPPVLVDLGASGKIHPKWKKIARHSVCLAFDPDKREMGIVSQSKDFKTLYIFDSIVLDKQQPQSTFYLTKSPFCSSTLKPETEKLQKWVFADLFSIEKEIKLKSIALSEALQQCNIGRIDWIKSDTQGTDLRIFQSLPKEIQQKVLVAEFEPGILDAYQGEDKLFELMKYMHSLNFWMADMEVKGTLRISPDHFSNTLKGANQELLLKCMKISPGWAETTYMKNPGEETKRDFLLLCIFALVEKQYGFALEVADKGYAQCQDNIFLTLRAHAVRKIKKEIYKLPVIFAKKVINKISNMIHG